MASLLVKGTLCIIVMLVPLTVTAEQVVLADFENLPVNMFPSGWKVRWMFWYREARGDEPYRINTEGGNQYLYAESHTNAITIGKPVTYDLSKYSYLSWRWKVNELPENGNEGNRDTSDSAAGVYVVFKGIRTIKYVWSTTLTPETVIKSPFSSRTKIIVVRTGRNQLNEWLTEKRNVIEDYKRVFKATNVKENPEAIAILTDSDSTYSTAIASYDDIVASTK